MTDGSAKTNNAFTTTVEKVINGKSDEFRKEFKEKIHPGFKEFKREIVTVIRHEMPSIKDQIFSELQKWRKEISLTTGIHQKLDNRDKRLDKLERIHLQGSTESSLNLFSAAVRAPLMTPPPGSLRPSL